MSNDLTLDDLLRNDLAALSTLAVEINLLNEQVEHHKNQAVIYAARTGVKLNEVKEGLGNDKAKFVAWLESNCTVKKTAAYNYIRLAKDMPQLLDSLVPSTGLPNLTQAIELLSAPEEVKTEVTAKIEAGEDVTIKEIQRLKKEAADLLASKQALQIDLMKKVELIDQKQQRISFLEVDRDTFKAQNDNLRNDLAFKVDEQVEARLAEERGKLILENQQAIAENKRLAENAQHELERLKREQDKAIADGVTLELNKLDTEIKQKRYQVECYERDLTDLKKVKSELDSEVGALAVHKDTIKNIKEHLSFLTVSFSDAFDTNIIPAEVSGEWDAIYFALSKLKTQMSDWRDRLNPLESHTIIDIETPWDDQ